MVENINRDLGRLEGKVDALLSAFHEERDATKDYRDTIQKDIHVALNRITTLEQVHDRIKWTVSGVMLAGSAIGAVAATVGAYVWKWLIGGQQ